MYEQFFMLDKELLIGINGFHNHVFDTIMLFVSSKFGWIPLYLLLVFIIIKDYRRNSWIVFFVVGLTIVISDLSSVYLFKNVFQRLRPCYNDELSGLLHMVKPCGGKYGFISSHAANSFAFAFLIIFLLKEKHRWIWIVMLLYATIISYSRVYLGVHYPSDVIGGAAIGALIGVGVYRLFNILPVRSKNPVISNNKEDQ